MKDAPKGQGRASVRSIITLALIIFLSLSSIAFTTNITAPIFRAFTATDVASTAALESSSSSEQQQLHEQQQQQQQQQDLQQRIQALRVSQWYQTCHDIIQANAKRRTISSGTPQHPIIFHLVFTTGDDTFNANNRKSLESIFYHYGVHNVSVLIHVPIDRDESRKPILTTAPFQDLIDKHQCDIHIVPFQAKDLIRDLLDRDFASEFASEVGIHDSSSRSSNNKTNTTTLSNVREQTQTFLDKFDSFHIHSKFWTVNLSDFTRLAALYLFGGIYIDTDIVLLRSMHDALPDNVAGYEDKKMTIVNNAVLKFDRPHSIFVELCLQDYFRKYNAKVWGSNGPQLITRTVQQLQVRRRGVVVDFGKDGSSTATTMTEQDVLIHIYPHSYLYPFQYREVKPRCLTNTELGLAGMFGKKLFQHSHTLHLNNALTQGDAGQPGSVCHVVLHSFCMTQRADCNVTQFRALMANATA